MAHVRGERGAEVHRRCCESVGGRFFSEWTVMSWQQAVALARQARKEFPSRLVFLGDSKHVWRIDELDDIS